jgi:hypothetical protein
MATVMYFHNTVNLKAGIYPVGEQHSGTPNYSFTDAATLRTMNTTIGTTQVVATGNSTAVTSAQEGFARMFTTPPLKGAYSFGGATDDLSLSIAVAESNASANLNNVRIHVYIWRPSTGAKIATLVNNVFGKTEPAANTETVWYQNVTSTAVSSLDGDVIVCEIWFSHSQATTASRTISLYYDGAVSNSTNNAVVSNHASYLLVQANLLFHPITTKRSSFFSFFNS